MRCYGLEGSEQDEYRARLLAVVKRKERGDEVHAPHEEEREAPTDLLDALRASVESAKNGRSNGRARPRSRKRRAKAKS